MGLGIIGVAWKSWLDQEAMKKRRDGCEGFVKRELGGGGDLREMSGKDMRSSENFHGLRV